MKIKWGALVVDGRGKLGGHVASQNKGGSYLRTKVTPVNPQSTYQTDVRSLFGTISAEWSGLGASGVKAWNSAVDEWKKTNIFGDLKIPSGKALYQRLNQQARLAGYTVIASPPAKEAMVSGTITAGAFVVGTPAITLTGVFAGSGAKVVYFATPPVSAGTTFVKNMVRQIGAGDANTYSASNAGDDYVLRFGTPGTGEKVYIGVKYVLANGQASPLQLTEVITT